MKRFTCLTALCSIAVLTTITSCQDEDFGYTADQIAYRTNFEKMYGSIDKIKTWDLSSYNLRQMGLEGGPGAGETRAAGGYTGNNGGATSADASLILSNNSLNGISGSGMDGEWYKVEDATLSWLNTKLPEGNYNVDLGKPFALGKPETDFAVIPIYQGHAGMNWDLHLVADGKDYTIWTKSQNIRYEEDYDQGVEYHYGSGALHDWQGTDPNKYATKIWLGGAFPESLRNGASEIKLKIVIPEGATLTGKFTTSDHATIWDFDGMGKGQTHSSNTYTYTLTTWPNFNDLNFVTGAGTNGCLLDGYNAARVRFYAIFEGKGSTMVELGSDVSNLTGHTVERKNVQSKPILIDKAKITSDFFLYLKIKAGDPDKEENYYANVGACQRSDEGMMVALPCTKPSNINSGYEYMIIGCEDANKNSDWDVNDIVFLLVGQGKLPRVKEIISKRYMIEDLGSTYDFDFNDIVVDVTQTTVKKYDGTTDTSVGNNGVTQTANLVHLCGTIPFQLKIGSTQLGKVNGNNNGCSEGGAGFDPATDPTTYGSYLNATVTGWDPAENNIEVTVWPREAGSTQYEGQTDGLLAHPEGQTYSFPESGDFPYIIACDQTVNWMPENYTVPRNWFNTWPASFDNWHHGTDSGQPETPTPSNLVELFTGSQSMTWDGEKIDIQTSALQECKEGSIIHVEGTEISASSRVKLAITNPWTDITSEACEFTSNTFSWTLTSDVASSIKESGLTVYGEGFTATKVTLQK